MNKRSIIIGAGNLGLTFAMELQAAGLLHSIVARSIVSFDKCLHHGIDESLICRSVSELDLAEYSIIIIAVGDNDILSVCNELFNCAAYRLKGKIVVHSSGSLKSDVLSSLEQFDCKIAAAHPYQTFYRPGLGLFDGVFFGIDSPDGELLGLSDVIKRLGAIPFYLDNINPDDKKLYHLSAVFASNFLNVLLSLSKSAALPTKIPYKEFIEPILLQTIKNNIQPDSTEIALTGPVAREDLSSITKHLSVLEKMTNERTAYILLTLCTIETALSKGKISKEFFDLAKSYLLNELRSAGYFEKY